MPLIVTVFAAQLPVTPAGRPLKVAPVAPVVLYVMFVIGVLMHTVWLSVPKPEVSTIVFRGVTVTFVLAEAVQPFASVTVRLYTPALAEVAPGIEGFCREDTNPFGPVHEYEAIPFGPPNRLMVPVWQTGLLLEADAMS